MSSTKDIEVLDAPDGIVAIARIGNGETLLGTVTHIVAPDGSRVPTFSLWTHACSLPVIRLVNRVGASLRFRVTDYTIADFLSAPHRQRLADFYQTACQQFGWIRHEHATLNVLYQLERAGIREIDRGNLRRAMRIVQATTQAMYACVRQFGRMELAGA